MRDPLRILSVAILSGHFFVSTALLSGCFTASYQPPVEDQTPYEGSGQWVLNPQEAMVRHRQGALFLDTRDKASWSQEHLPGAQHVTWQSFSQPDAPDRGKLLTDAKLLTQKLQALGIRAQKPVVVVGDPARSWGEDGRIVWMLRTLGHPNAALVDGGHEALKRLGMTMEQTTTAPKQGDFVVARDMRWEISRDALKRQIADGAVSKKQLQLIDTREQREYEGQTPYGESRGGHIPGAVHIHYKELLRPDGMLHSKATILARLAQRGLSPETKETTLIAYCTGGVRSAWFVVLLLDLGFAQVKNYTGSMWEWSAAPADTHPLEKSR